MLIIFDCDGVLVDSEVLAAKVFSNALAPHNFLITPEECFKHFQGRNLKYCFEYLEKTYKKKLPLNFIDELNLATQEAFSSQLDATKNIALVLQYLQHKSIEFCVASNGGHEKILHSLRVTNLLDYFAGKIFSADDVDEGKPAPDLFLYAAKSTGYSTAECWVIEDSCAGVQAALNAKMKVVGFGPTRHRGANHYARDAKALLCYLQEIIEHPCS